MYCKVRYYVKPMNLMKAIQYVDHADSPIFTRRSNDPWKSWRSRRREAIGDDAGDNARIARYVRKACGEACLTIEKSCDSSYK
jgi:hypothetical protein